MTEQDIDQALTTAETVMGALEAGAQAASKVGLPFAGIAAAVLDVAQKAAERGHDINAAWHTKDQARAQALLDRANAFAAAQEDAALA